MRIGTRATAGARAIRRAAKVATAALAIGGGFYARGAAAQSYQDTVLATNPEAYFRLTGPGTGSLTGGYTTMYQGSAATGAGAPLVSDPANTGALFDGVNSVDPGIVRTSLYGGIPAKGTILAWVNLSRLPSTTGTIMYVAGESQSGNDFDIQFEPDNALRFYTGAGENTAYTPAAGSLLGQWHFIAATYDATLGGDSFRNLYWDGALGTGYTGGVSAGTKNSQFTIGYSPVFTNREFAGSIDEVAVYDRALTAAEIRTIYAARNTAATDPGAVPEPASWAMLILGAGAVGGFARRRRGVAAIA